MSKLSWPKRIAIVLSGGLLFCVVALIVLIKITGPSDEERAAIEAAAEAERIAAWKAKTQPAASEIALEDYDGLCGSVSSEVFDNRCRGKWIVWDVFVEAVLDPDLVRVKSGPVSGRAFDISLSQTVKWEEPLERFKGSKFRVAGLIGDKNLIYDDIVKASIVSALDLSTAEQTALDTEKRQKQLKASSIEAYLVCKRALVDVAKFPSEVDCPFIPDYRWRETETGFHIRGVCGLMNGFGNVVPHTFDCHVDGEDVTAIEAVPGG